MDRILAILVRSNNPIFCVKCINEWILFDIWRSVWGGCRVLLYVFVKIYVENMRILRTEGYTTMLIS